MTYSWLLSPLVQIQDSNGLPVVGGKVYVYDADTENLATIYADDTGTTLSNPVLTDTLGNVTLFGETGVLYDIAVYDSTDLLLFAKKHVQPGTEGGGGTTAIDINAGNGCIVSKNGNIFTISVDFDAVASQAELALKQDKLEAGNNIEITQQNVINVTGRRAIVTQEPLVSNMSDNAWVVSFDTNAFIGTKGIMVKPELELDPTSSRYVGYDGIPLGESASPFTGASANIPFTGNGTNESPLGLMPYISYGGNGITSTYSKSGLRVLDSNNNSAFYSSSGINLNNASITDTYVTSWNDVYNTVSTASGSWGGNFPIVSETYTADCNSSAFKISTTTSTMTLSESGAKYVAYPSTNIDATWTQIISKANEVRYIPTVSSYTFVVNDSVDVQYSAVDMLNEISFIAASWGNFLNYSANFLDGNINKGTLVIPSGKVMTATKNWNWEDNGFKWNKKLQDGTLMAM